MGRQTFSSQRYKDMSLLSFPRPPYYCYPNALLPLGWVRVPICVWRGCSLISLPVVSCPPHNSSQTNCPFPMDCCRQNISLERESISQKAHVSSQMPGLHFSCFPCPRLPVSPQLPGPLGAGTVRRLFPLCMAAFLMFYISSQISAPPYLGSLSFTVPHPNQKSLLSLVLPVSPFRMWDPGGQRLEVPCPCLPCPWCIASPDQNSQKNRTNGQV